VEKFISGLHHITALCSNAQKNLEFYSGILGLRLVKKTVNFDAPDIYHLYYGDELGVPGTIMTFFPINGLAAGRKGKGQLTITSFSIPADSVDYWINRLDKFNVNHGQPQRRFEEEYIYLEDSEGLGLELVANDTDERKGYAYGVVPEQNAIRGFYGIVLNEDSIEKTANLLTEQMDFTILKEEGNRIRFFSPGKSANFVDILNNSESIRGISGSGTIHHVAFAVADDQEQFKVREKLINAGLSVTPVVNRDYFHSIYFREPGGVLFEVATSDIGFTIDESVDKLGESLKLPKWVESDRIRIESQLQQIQFEGEKFRD
jgi:glyoxalase family protein